MEAIGYDEKATKVVAIVCTRSIIVKIVNHVYSVLDIVIAMVTISLKTFVKEHDAVANYVSSNP